jgi:hypothetical protein
MSLAPPEIRNMTRPDGNLFRRIAADPTEHPAHGA